MNLYMNILYTVIDCNHTTINVNLCWGQLYVLGRLKEPVEI